MGERLAIDIDGVDEGVDVVLFGGGRGAAQRQVGERPTLGRMKMKPASRWVPRPALLR